MALYFGCKPPANPAIIKYLENHIDKSLKCILKTNKCENLVPFNLWFEHDDYEVLDSYENFQHIRLRFFKGNLLTPLQTNSDQHAYIENLRLILPDMTLYQPFYPETFYEMWELQRIRHGLVPSENFNNCLVVAKEMAFGSMEALMLHCEKYQHTYQANIYDLILAEKPYILENDAVQFQLPEHNYLGQAYSVNILQYIDSNTTYDCIVIDCLSLKEDIVSYKSETMDLACTMFYVGYVLNQLRNKSTLILHIDYACSDSWSVLFGMLNDYFVDISVQKPLSTNPLNTRVYVTATGFNLMLFKSKPQIYFDFIASYYIEDMYSNFTLDFIKSKFWTKFLSATKNLVDVNQVVDAKQFCVENDLATVGSLSSEEIHTQQSTSISTIIQYKLTTKSDQLVIGIPDAHGLFSHPDYKRLISKRGQLNACKRTMDTKPSNIFVGSCIPEKTFFTTWDQLSTKMQAPYYSLKKNLKNHFNAEHPTNAWTKMYEMLCFYEPLVLPTDVKKIRSMHLCEAPGAFILATNHFAKTRGFDLDWYAQTLRPDDKNDALQDSFGLIQKYPDRWLFGEDDSGDITKSSVIKSYASNPKLKKLDFITADAGLICSPQELNEQETKLCKINLGQVTCILACLAKGKSAIFKTFLPLSEPLNLSLMYVLVHLFDEVYITKPATSNPCNSEVYVVLNSFTGIESVLLDALYELLDSEEITAKTLFCPKMKAAFYKSYLDVMTELINRQINAIHESYRYYFDMSNIDYGQQHIHDIIEAWLNQNPIVALQDSDKLI
jgi:hypothetical protein